MAMLSFLWVTVREWVQLSLPSGFQYSVLWERAPEFLQRGASGAVAGHFCVAFTRKTCPGYDFDSKTVLYNLQTGKENLSAKVQQD